MFSLRVCMLTSFMQMSSILISPSSISTNLNKDYTIELLPAPVLPTTPTFIPPSILKLALFTA